MTGSKRSYKGFCYMVIDAKTDLPLSVLDTGNEVMRFLEVSRATLYKMIKQDTAHKGMKVEKVLL